MIGIEIDCQRLSSPVAALGQLNPKLDRRDIVGSATCERLHVERAPVVVLGSANPVVARHGVAGHDLLT